MEQEIKQLMDEFKGRFTVFIKAWNGFRTEFELEMLWSIDDAVENHEDCTIGCFMHEQKKKDDVMPFEDLRDSYYHIYNIMRALEAYVWELDMMEQHIFCGISRYMKRVHDIMEYIYRVYPARRVPTWTDLVDAMTSKEVNEYEQAQ